MNALKDARLAFAEHGLALRDELIYPGNFSQTQSFEIARRIMSEPEKVSAIVTLSNLMTVGVMRALVSTEPVEPTRPFARSASTTSSGPRS